MANLIRVGSAPGVQRDGTLFDGQAYSDAVWCRMYRGRPKKMGGFRELTRNLNGVGRGMHVDAVNQYSYVHVGEAAALERMLIEIRTGVPTGVIDRTPVAFASNVNNLWQFDSEFDVGTTNNYVLAHAAPNLTNIANDVTGPVYFGGTTGTAPLTAISGSDVSGGVVCLHPYTVIYGSDGYLAWSVAGVPTDLTSLGSGAARPTASKIVQGLPIRSYGGAASGLFWGLDTLSKLSYVGGQSVFQYDTISAASSVLSSASIIEHNGIYYWVSVGGFLMFNGVIRDIPNDYNHAWFLKNINMAYAQKMFATKMPQWREIWWCFPKGTATENNWAIVYNYMTNVWYDTPLPAGGRSCGYYEQIFPYPLMTTAGMNSSSKYSLWQHEVGVDEISGAVPQTLAIKSSFRTNQVNVITPPPGGPGQDVELSVTLIEPDLKQTGDMTVRIYAAANAAVVDPPLVAEAPIPQPSTGTQEQLPGFTVANRLLQFEFESNVAGGDYEAGIIIAHVDEAGDRHVT